MLEIELLPVSGFSLRILLIHNQLSKTYIIILLGLEKEFEAPKILRKIYLLISKKNVCIGYRCLLYYWNTNRNDLCSLEMLTTATD